MLAAAAVGGVQLDPYLGMVTGTVPGLDLKRQMPSRAVVEAQLVAPDLGRIQEAV